MENIYIYIYMSKIRVFEGKTTDFGVKTRHTKHSTVATTCTPKRAFRIWVICANQTLVAKVMAKILSRTRKLLQLSQITISCQSCADLPAPGKLATSTCNLTT
jgi:hypothetical protein